MSVGKVPPVKMAGCKVPPVGVNKTFLKNIKKYRDKRQNLDNYNDRNVCGDTDNEEELVLNYLVDHYEKKPEVKMYLRLELALKSFSQNNEEWRQLDDEVQAEIIKFAIERTSSSGCSIQSSGKEEVDQQREEADQQKEEADQQKEEADQQKEKEQGQKKGGEVLMESGTEDEDGTRSTDEGFCNDDLDTLADLGTYEGFLKEGMVGNRGTFHIFWFTHDRPGAEKDEVNFKEMAQLLGFTDIRCHQDFTAQQIRNELKNYSEKDHSEDDCVVCAISAHGSFQDRICVGGGEKVGLNDFVKHFSEQNCSGLKGKPKLIIVQSCRGDMMEESNESSSKVHQQTEYGNTENTAHEDLTTNYKDLILASSTIPTKRAIRNTVHGTYYVRYLLEEVQSSNDREICEILSNVSRRLGELVFDGGKKQMACFRSNLTKQLYLTRGNPLVSTGSQQCGDEEKDISSISTEKIQHL